MPYVLKKLEKKIRTCIEEGLEEGYYLVQCVTNDDGGGFCAAGMCIRRDYDDLYERARIALGLTPSEMRQFTWGFDNQRYTFEKHSELFYLGARLRDYYMVDPH